MRVSINNIEHVGRNLWKYGGTYFRLFGYAATPNGCWVAAPEMRELADIDVATGADVYGPARLGFDACGTVPACYEFISIRRAQ